MILSQRTRVLPLPARASALVKRQNALMEIVKPQLQTPQISPLNTDQVVMMVVERIRIQGDLLLKIDWACANVNTILSVDEPHHEAGAHSFCLAIYMSPCIYSVYWYRSGCTNTRISCFYKLMLTVLCIIFMTTITIVSKSSPVEWTLLRPEIYIRYHS